MTRFTIASFNMRNLIGPEREYYRFQSYTPEEYAWKADWLADQLLTLDADITGFQEVFEEQPLRQVLAEADRRGQDANSATLPDTAKRYQRRANFSGQPYTPYGTAALAFAPNINDSAELGQRRPGVALLSRFGFSKPPEVIQELDQPLDISMACPGGGGEAGFYALRRLSRPILKARVPIGGQDITVFTCHLKSKRGEYIAPPGSPCPSEEVLTAYDPAGRALGALRASLRRMGEAMVLRRAILDELDQDRPVLVTGDFNDGEGSATSAIIAGEQALPDYSWLRRPDAATAEDRYTPDESRGIREAVDSMRLRSASGEYQRKAQQPAPFTTAFGGHQDRFDEIYLSRHFDPDWPGARGRMEHFSVLNDHLTDGSAPEAPYNRLVPDHGQIMAHMVLDG